MIQRGQPGGRNRGLPAAHKFLSWPLQSSHGTPSSAICSALRFGIEFTLNQDSIAQSVSTRTRPNSVFVYVFSGSFPIYPLSPSLLYLLSLHLPSFCVCSDFSSFRSSFPDSLSLTSLLTRPPLFLLSLLFYLGFARKDSASSPLASSPLLLPARSSPLTSRCRIPNYPSAVIRIKAVRT